MKEEFGFFKTTIPDNRKADFYLCCIDGPVFLDFNYIADKCIYLCRIYFDAYGCYRIDNKAKYLEKQL